ncbi:hypothetical protein Leryth_019233 [Lithospermum erythrorhizon]|nr:hypothetical protein Leryth_019233 [Lithospermum erythrorhizon]
MKDPVFSGLVYYHGFSKDCQLGDSDWSVKRVVRTHSGCPDGKINLCNSTFLAKVLEGKLRCFVDEMFHVKIGNNCAERRRPSRRWRSHVGLI